MRRLILIRHKISKPRYVGLYWPWNNRGSVPTLRLIRSLLLFWINITYLCCITMAETYFDMVKCIYSRVGEQNRDISRSLIHVLGIGLTLYSLAKVRSLQHILRILPAYLRSGTCQRCMIYKQRYIQRPQHVCLGYGNVALCHKYPMRITVPW